MGMAFLVGTGFGIIVGQVIAILLGRWASGRVRQRRMQHWQRMTPEERAAFVEQAHARIDQEVSHL